MVEVALEDRVMAKMYGRVVFKFMNKILEVAIFCVAYLCFAYLLDYTSQRTAQTDEN